MGKLLFKFFLVIIIVIVSGIVFLSYFGIETNKFNDLIKEKTNQEHQQVQLEFQKTKIYLNPKELNLVVKLLEPKILIKNSEIILSKLNLFLSLKAFITSDFLLQKGQIAFEKNDIRDLTKVTSLFIPKIFNKQLKKIFKKGSLEGELIIPFDTDGNLGKDFGFSGKIINASIHLPNNYLIKNLTTKINFGNESKDGDFEVTIEKGSLLGLQLVGSTVNLKLEEDKIKTKSLLHTKGIITFSQIKKITSLLDLNINSFKNINGDIDIKSKIIFDLSKKLKLTNLLYSVSGNLKHFEIDTEEKKIIKRYLPEYNSKVVLKNTNVQLSNSKTDFTAELKGLIKVKNDFDKFEIKEKYNYKKNFFNIRGILDLTNSKIQILKLNYNKDHSEKSKLDFDINFILNKNYNIKKFNFSSGKNKVFLANIEFNKNLEIVDFKKLEIKTFLNKNINNDFVVNKNKKIIISGQVFDAQELLESLYKKDEKKMFSKIFNSEIRINFNKVITGTNDDVSNFAMIASMKEGSFNKLSLKGNFSKNEIVEMSIYQVDKDKKTLQLISDRARPFIKNFDFIKGFEGGKLEYETVISKGASNSNLILTDFKVSKVPALAQLLTLASLQGIADTLTGEGISFESFEMKSNSTGNVMNIEDALAIGPAVSILLDGYIDKGKIVSLRGTLVPATKLNSIIASIPLVGNILVGKKTGEGVVGVSFKMKGPPKKIKTTVNPIKTLTPRFIVRAVEKMKRKKQNQAK